MEDNTPSEQDKIVMPTTLRNTFDNPQKTLPTAFDYYFSVLYRVYITMLITNEVHLSFNCIGKGQFVNLEEQEQIDVIYNQTNDELESFLNKEKDLRTAIDKIYYHYFLAEEYIPNNICKFTNKFPTNPKKNNKELSREQAINTRRMFFKIGLGQIVFCLETLRRLANDNNISELNKLSPEIAFITFAIGQYRILASKNPKQILKGEIACQKKRAGLPKDLVFKGFFIDWCDGVYDGNKSYNEIIGDIMKNNEVGIPTARKFYAMANKQRKRQKKGSR